jgi:hypothetical protein
MIADAKKKKGAAKIPMAKRRSRYHGSRLWDPGGVEASGGAALGTVATVVDDTDGGAWGPDGV